MSTFPIPCHVSEEWLGVQFINWLFGEEEVEEVFQIQDIAYAKIQGQKTKKGKIVKDWEWNLLRTKDEIKDK